MPAPSGLLPAPLCPGEAVVGAALGSPSEQGTPWHPAEAAGYAGGPRPTPRPGAVRVSLLPPGRAGALRICARCLSRELACAPRPPGHARTASPPQSPLPAALRPAGSLARKRWRETAPELSGGARMLCGQADTAVLQPRIFLGHFSRPVSQMAERLPARTGSPAPPAARTGTAWIHSGAVALADGCSQPPCPGSRGAWRVPSPSADSETRGVTHCPVRGPVMVTVTVGDGLARLRDDLFVG